ncbi:hypothetical protein Tco_0463035 [Tanacetum coccineum]
MPCPHGLAPPAIKFRELTFSLSSILISVLPVMQCMIRGLALFGVQSIGRRAAFVVGFVRTWVARNTSPGELTGIVKKRNMKTLEFQEMRSVPLVKNFKVHDDLTRYLYKYMRERMLKEKLSGYGGKLSKAELLTLKGCVFWGLERITGRAVGAVGVLRFHFEELAGKGGGSAVRVGRIRGSGSWESWKRGATEVGSPGAAGGLGGMCFNE